jgi:hypothetical protein
MGCEGGVPKGCVGGVPWGVSRGEADGGELREVDRARVVHVEHAPQLEQIGLTKMEAQHLPRVISREEGGQRGVRGGPMGCTMVWQSRRSTSLVTRVNSSASISPSPLVSNLQRGDRQRSVHAVSVGRQPTSAHAL